MGDDGYMDECDGFWRGSVVLLFMVRLCMLCMRCGAVVSVLRYLGNWGLETGCLLDAGCWIGPVCT